MLGEIRMFPFKREPEGHMLCDGRALKIKDYPALYSLIGTEHGGDGVKEFGIPRITNAEEGLYFFIHVCDDDYPVFEG